MSDELAIIDQDLVPLSGTLTETLPTDAVPFAEMATLFGAASTVMLYLQQNVGGYASVERIYQQISLHFAPRGKEFWGKVMWMVLQYYAGRDKHDAWDAAVKARNDLIRSMPLYASDVRRTVQKYTRDREIEDEATRLLIATDYSHLR